MKIAIVGAGITGLVAGHELAKAGQQVTVYEHDDVPGGLTASFAFPGKRLCRLYHHIFEHSRSTLGLLGELGLAGDMEWYQARTGYYHGGRVHRLMTALDLLRFRPLSLPNRIRFGLGIARARRITDWRPLDARTATDWLTAIFGRRIYETMWEPLLRSKFGDAHTQVSAAWFWYKLHQRGGRKGRAERLGHLVGSFGRLPEALATAIGRLGGRVALATPLERLAWDADGLAVTARPTRSAQAAEEHPRFDRVLVTAAPPVLLAAAPALPAAYREQLGAIEYLANLCVVLALEHPITDMYWLNINDAGFPFNAVIGHTNLVPRERYLGHHVAYLTRYLPRDDPQYGESDDELLDLYEPFLRRLAPSFQRAWVRNMYVFRSDFAAPLTPRGYARRVPSMATPVAGLYLANMSQIYPEDRGIDAGIALGREAARRILADARPA